MCGREGGGSGGGCACVVGWKSREAGWWLGMWRVLGVWLTGFAERGEAGAFEERSCWFGLVFGAGGLYVWSRVDVCCRCF